MKPKLTKKEIAHKKRLDKSTDDLYKAVQKYIEIRGGKLLVIGGVETIVMPNERAYCFHLGVKCMGRIPKAEWVK